MINTLVQSSSSSSSSTKDGLIINTRSSLTDDLSWWSDQYPSAILFITMITIINLRLIDQQYPIIINLRLIMMIWSVPECNSLHHYDHHHQFKIYWSSIPDHHWLKINHDDQYPSAILWWSRTFCTPAAIPIAAIIIMFAPLKYSWVNWRLGWWRWWC